MDNQKKLRKVQYSVYEPALRCNLDLLASSIDIVSGNANDIHAGAAFPAKKTTRRLTVLRSAGFIFFNNKYPYRTMSDINISTGRKCLHVWHPKCLGSDAIKPALSEKSRNIVNRTLYSWIRWKTWNYWLKWGNFIYENRTLICTSYIASVRIVSPRVVST